MKCKILFSGTLFQYVICKHVYNFDTLEHRFYIVKLFFFAGVGAVYGPFQEYFTYIELIVLQRWAKTGEPGEKPPDHP